MTAYVVANFSVHDPKRFDEYRALVRETVDKYGGSYLLVNTEPNDLDGKSHQFLVVLTFDSIDAAQRWYDSTEYQAILDHRLASTEGWVRLAPSMAV